jgi:hypothetical protein
MDNVLVVDAHRWEVYAPPMEGMHLQGASFAVMAVTASKDLFARLMVIVSNAHHRKYARTDTTIATALLSVEPATNA